MDIGIFKEKKIIAGVIVFFLIVGGIFHLLSQGESYKRVGVLLRFENIHRGQYPDGTAFNKNDLVDEGVLEKALDEVGELSPAVLSQHLEVQGVIPGEIQGASEEAVEDFNPNEYRLNLYRGEELGLSPGEQKELLTAIVEEYEEEFSANIRLDYSLPGGEELLEEMDNYDYPFFPQVLESQLEALKGHASDFEARERTFVSEEHGYSFGDVAYNIENLKENRVDRLRSLIMEHNLSREPDTTIQRYLNMIQELEAEIDKKEEQATYALDMLAEIEAGEFDGEDPEALEELTELETGLEDNIIEDLLRHEYYPELLGQSLEAGVSAEEMKIDLAYYQEILAGIEAGDVAEAQEAEELMERADEKTEEILSSLDDYRLILDDMRTELFYDELDEVVEINRGPEVVTPGPSFLMNAGIFGVIGVFSGFGAGFLKLNWSYFKDRLLEELFVKEASEEAGEENSEEAREEENKNG